MGVTSTISARPAGVSIVSAPRLAASVAGNPAAVEILEEGVVPVAEDSPAAAGLRRFALPSEVTAALEETLRRSRELVARRESGVQHRSKQLGKDGHLYDRSSSGVPRDTRLIIVGDRKYLSAQDPSDTVLLSAGTVFRHYTTPEFLRSITDDAVLIPGPLPVSHGAEHTYSDLVGAFLAFPRFSPTDVGVPSLHHFVDLRLHEGTGLVAPGTRDYGKYLMIPGVPKQRDWYLALYQRWEVEGKPSREIISRRIEEAWAVYKASDMRDEHAHETYLFWSHLNSAYLDSFLAIDRQGGFPKPSRIPIRVVNTGRVP